jgi:hypothetical protein
MSVGAAILLIYFGLGLVMALIVVVVDRGRSDTITVGDDPGALFWLYIFLWPIWTVFRLVVRSRGSLPQDATLAKDRFPSDARDPKPEARLSNG